ncbi:hypothetical protein BFJ63_vAg15740 [Fusarium oxysporum f. sp. narcissi]|jgi:hypothetical protein|uniref:Uncharacterized protein n=1 Tax=Fusarium oxysporum f. sp. narcissi TaxID=451672 RepID=A0A4Q2V4W6_FUSOX|nr:hypothetical protein BFJ63_vAg15740 [Fusarium oxysporum f. sp. narcissi]
MRPTVPLILADYVSVVHSDDPNQMAQASSHPLTMIVLPQTLVPARTPPLAVPPQAEGAHDADADSGGNGEG